MRGKSFPRIPWSEFVNERNQQFCDEDALDLISKMLQFDKNERITPKEAMKHAYFDPVRDMIIEQEAKG